jgi:hypothetical protein
MTTPDPQAPPAAPEAHTAEVDRRLTGIETTLAGITASLHDRAQAHTERRLERPQTVAEQVDAAVRQAQADQARAAKEQQTDSTLSQLAADVKDLRETKPAQGVTRPIHKIMGWAK